MTTQRILVVGSTGSGKSSLINLLSLKETAVVSNSLKGCTLQCTDFHINHENQPYFLTDTVGFDEPKDGSVSHGDAIKNLVKFAKEHKDGFNLILFVMKYDRIKKSFVDTYNFFYEVLFSTEVPCILYISNTEVADDVHNWLVHEKQHLDKTFRFKKIICGTTKQSNNPYFEKVFVEMRKDTYDHIWLAIKENSRPDSFQMKTGLTLWATIFNKLYYILSFGGKYYQPKVEKDLQNHLRQMQLQEDVIKEILQFVAN